MAAGKPISLLAMPRYQTQSEMVRDLYASGSAEDAWNLARSLRIDYLYVDGTERAAYPRGVEKFDAAPELFERVFSSGDVAVYARR
jgi:uncharacterized membrane protein